MRIVKFCNSLPSKGFDNFGVICESKGIIVSPAWPPITGTVTSDTDFLKCCNSSFRKPYTKVSARTTSSFVTPKTFRGSNALYFFSTSTAMGTVEFTGFEIMFKIALGQYFATPTVKSLTIPALILNKSSLVMPGFLGIPAGMMTKSHPTKASLNWSGPAYPVTSDSVLMCDKSTATPGVIGAISYNRKAFIRGDCFNSNESVCPIPPAAPKTATVNFSLFFQNRASLRSMMACVVGILASDDEVNDDEDGGGSCDSLARTS